MSTLGWYNIVYINSNYFYWEMWFSVTLRNFNFIYTWYIFSCNIIYFSLHIDFSKKIFLFQGSSDWLEWLTEVSELLSEVTGRYTNYCSLGFCSINMFFENFAISPKQKEINKLNVISKIHIVKMQQKTL